MLSKLRTKMTEERGESIVHLTHVPLKKYNAQGLICTILAHHRRRMVMCMLTASVDLVGKMMVMKCFSCSVFYPPRWLNLPEVWRSNSDRDAESDSCSVWLGIKRRLTPKAESLQESQHKSYVWLCGGFCLCIYLNKLACVYVSVRCSCRERNLKWWKMCLQQFSELFSWRRGTFFALALSI